MSDWKELPPTEKQLEFIGSISSLTGVAFNGTTRYEASAYIDKNIKDYWEMRKLQCELDGIANNPNR